MTNKRGKNYIAYADILRILAAFSVVLLHTAGAFLISVQIDSDPFLWAAFFDCVTRWSVPLFIMLSGMLFLDKKKKLDIKKLYTKNILRMVTAFVFWSYLYNFYTAFAALRDIKKASLQALRNMPNGAMHLWFIFIIVGLYIILPFVKRMTENMTKGECEYFILLGIILTFLPKTLSSFEMFKPYLEYIQKFEINYAAGYVSLFVAGWYINNFKHSSVFKAVSYILGIMGFLYMFSSTVYVSRMNNIVADEFMSFKSLSSFLMAFAVMLLFKSLFEKKHLSRKTVSNIAFYSKYTFGIYLIHEMFLSMCISKDWLLLRDMPYIGIPLQAAIVFILSGIIIGIITWLPFGKYIS